MTPVYARALCCAALALVSCASPRGDARVAAPRAAADRSAAGARPAAPPADDPPGPQGSAWIQTLIAHLGSDRFEVREGASRSLVELGGAAVPALQEALRHGDPEVRARAGRVLEQIDLPTEDLTPEAKEILVRLREIKVTLEFQDQPLSEVIDFLRAFTKLNFIVDADVKAEDLKVTLKVQNLPLDSALKLILGGCGLTYAADDGYLRILPKGRVRHLNFNRQRAKAVAADPAAAGMRDKMKNMKIELDFRDAGLADLLDFFRTYSSLNVVVDSAVQSDSAVMDKKVTFKVKDLPLDRTLSLLLEQYGLDYTFREHVIYITRPGRER